MTKKKCYKGQEIKLNENFFCKECFKFFNVTGNTKLSKINCPYCDTDNTVWNLYLVKAKIDNKSHSKIIEICKGLEE